MSQEKSDETVHEGSRAAELSVGETYLLKYFSPTHKKVIAVNWEVTNRSRPHASIQWVDLSQGETGKKCGVRQSALLR